jgi:ABC-type multidrug transport system fused ATPase/permease subunit
MANVKALLLNEEEDYENGGGGGREERELVAISSGSRDYSDRLVLLKQLRALFLKDLTLQSRAIATNVFQLLTPMIFISFAGLMQIILNIILKEHQTPVPGTGAVPFPMDISRSLTCHPANNSYNNPDIEMINGTIIGIDKDYNITDCHDNFLNFLSDYEHLYNLVTEFHNGSKYNESKYSEHLKYLNLVTFARPQDLLFNLPMFYIGKSEGVAMDLGHLTFDGNYSGFIGGAVPQEWRYNFSTNFSVDHHWPLERNFTEHYSNDGGPYLTVPFFLPIPDLSTLNHRLDKVIKRYGDEAESSADYYADYQRNYITSPLSSDQFNTTIHLIKGATRMRNTSLFEQLRPSGALFLDQLTTTQSSLTLNYTIVANDLSLEYPNIAGKDQATFTEALDTHQRNNLINMMSNALFKNLTGAAGTDPVAIATYIMPLPTPPMYLTLDISTILGGVLYPYATSFLLPVYMAMLVKDKSEKHLIMMEQNGLSRWTYWAVTYIFNFMLYALIAIIITIFSLAFQIRLFTQTNAVVLILVFLLWGHAQIALGFFFSNFFTSPRAAIIIGYLLVFASVAVALLLELLKIFPPNKTPFPVYMFYPPFVFYRILYYMINACFGYSCLSVTILDPTQGLNLVTTAMLYLGLETLVLLVLSVYLSYVLPGDYGVRKSPFFPLIALYKCCKYAVMKISGKKLEPESDMTQPHSPVRLLTTTAEGFVDEDVTAEHELLSQGFPPDAPVVMYQLRKEYPGSGGAPPHVAVHSVSLVIQRNECFGLLGPNGAGKTTLISVLTGMYEPTRGTARIAGYDIQTEV